MKPSEELEQKLQKRLRVQNEPAQAPAAAGHSRAASPAASQPPSEAASPAEAAPRRARLREQLSAVAAEREEALEQRRKAEDEGIARTIELSSEVARLRVDVEVLRRDLEAAQLEVNKLRASQHLQERRDRMVQEQTAQADLELVLAEAQAQHMACEVAGSAAEKSSLQEQVRHLEEQVASHVVGRVRLEALLRKSEVKEAEMRKLLDSVEASGGRRTGSKAVAAFSMNAGDEEEEDRGAVPEAECAVREELDDIESSYEVLSIGAELERTLQLVRMGGPWASGTGGQILAGSELPMAGAAEGGGKGGAPEAGDSYEAPLRELEVALARLRGGTGGGTADGARSGGLGAGVPAAGTGEAADDLSVFDEHLGRLQETLALLGATAQRSPAIPEEQEAAAAGTTSRAPEELPPEPQPLPMAPLVGFGLFRPYAMLGHKYQLLGK